MEHVKTFNGTYRCRCEQTTANKQRGCTCGVYPAIGGYQVWPADRPARRGLFWSERRSAHGAGYYDPCTESWLSGESLGNYERLRNVDKDLRVEAINRIYEENVMGCSPTCGHVCGCADSGDLFESTRRRLEHEIATAQTVMARLEVYTEMDEPDGDVRWTQGGQIFRALPLTGGQWTVLRGTTAVKAVGWKALVTEYLICADDVAIGAYGAVLQP